MAALRTVRTLINNLVIGVTRGFKYKMRYVYAHFPINVNIDKNKETGLFEVEIRYVSAISVCCRFRALRVHEDRRGEGRPRKSKAPQGSMGVDGGRPVDGSPTLGLEEAWRDRVARERQEGPGTILDAGYRADTQPSPFNRNFLGEKLARRVAMRPGVDVEVSKAQKDELILHGNSLESVSQCAADVQQICRVRNKDIRKVRWFSCPTMILVATISHHSWLANVSC